MPTATSPTAPVVSSIVDLIGNTPLIRLAGFEAGLGPRAKAMIVARATYEPTDPTVDSQIAALKAYHTARAVLERLTARHAERIDEGGIQDED